jgi:hypothetical protein
MNRLVTVKKYAQISGYSEEAIRQKIKKGVWQLGRHVFKGPDGRLMIKVEEVETWITNCPAA